MEYTFEEILAACKDNHPVTFVHKNHTANIYNLSVQKGEFIVKWDNFPEDLGDSSGVQNYGFQTVEYLISDGHWINFKIHAKPHKHKTLIIAWANGAEIQCKIAEGKWANCISPHWREDMEYRIKPDTVKKWRWVVNLAIGNILAVTRRYYSDQSDYDRTFPGNTDRLAQRIDESEVEMLEDQHSLEG